MSQRERRNPFYLLLLLTSALFVLTALALGVVPVLEEKAADMGNPPPPSALRDALRRDGWIWLLIEGGAVAVFGIASMVLDHLRRLQKERAAPTIPPGSNQPSV
jgi:hypothetical protein